MPNKNDYQDPEYQDYLNRTALVDISRAPGETRKEHRQNIRDIAADAAYGVDGWDPVALSEGYVNLAGTRGDIRRFNRVMQRASRRRLAEEDEAAAMSGQATPEQFSRYVTRGIDQNGVPIAAPIVAGALGGVASGYLPLSLEGAYQFGQKVAPWVTGFLAGEVADRIPTLYGAPRLSDQFMDTGIQTSKWALGDSKLANGIGVGLGTLLSSVVPVENPVETGVRSTLRSAARVADNVSDAASSLRSAARAGNADPNAIGDAIRTVQGHALANSAPSRTPVRVTLVDSNGGTRNLYSDDDFDLMTDATLTDLDRRTWPDSDDARQLRQRLNSEMDRRGLSRELPPPPREVNIDLNRPTVELPQPQTAPVRARVTMPDGAIREIDPSDDLGLMTNGDLVDDYMGRWNDDDVSRSIRDAIAQELSVRGYDVNSPSFERRARFASYNDNILGYYYDSPWYRPANMDSTELVEELRDRKAADYNNYIPEKARARLVGEGTDALSYLQHSISNNTLPETVITDIFGDDYDRMAMLAFTLDNDIPDLLRLSPENKTAIVDSLNKYAREKTRQITLPKSGSRNLSEFYKNMDAVEALSDDDLSALYARAIDLSNNNMWSLNAGVKGDDQFINAYLLEDLVSGEKAARAAGVSGNTLKTLADRGNWAAIYNLESDFNLDNRVKSTLSARLRKHLTKEQQDQFLDYLSDNMQFNGYTLSSAPERELADRYKAKVAARYHVKDGNIATPYDLQDTGWFKLNDFELQAIGRELNKRYPDSGVDFEDISSVEALARNTDFLRSSKGPLPYNTVMPFDATSMSWFSGSDTSPEATSAPNRMIKAQPNKSRNSEHHTSVDSYSVQVINATKDFGTEPGKLSLIHHFNESEGIHTLPPAGYDQRNHYHRNYLLLNGDGTITFGNPRFTKARQKVGQSVGYPQYANMQMTQAERDAINDFINTGVDNQAAQKYYQLISDLSQFDVDQLNRVIDAYNLEAGNYLRLHPEDATITKLPPALADPRIADKRSMLKALMSGSYVRSQPLAPRISVYKHTYGGRLNRKSLAGAIMNKFNNSYADALDYVQTFCRGGKLC